MLEAFLPLTISAHLLLKAVQNNTQSELTAYCVLCIPRLMLLEDSRANSTWAWLTGFKAAVSLVKGYSGGVHIFIYILR